jgi:hypothetical protein
MKKKTLSNTRDIEVAITTKMSYTLYEAVSQIIYSLFCAANALRSTKQWKGKIDDDAFDYVNETHDAYDTLLIRVEDAFDRDKLISMLGDVIPNKIGLGLMVNLMENLDGEASHKFEFDDDFPSKMQRRAYLDKLVYWYVEQLQPFVIEIAAANMSARALEVKQKNLAALRRALQTIGEAGISVSLTQEQKTDLGWSMPPVKSKPVKRVRAARIA